MLKLTKTGIGLLTRQYRSVLKKCFLLNTAFICLINTTHAGIKSNYDVYIEGNVINNGVYYVIDAYDGRTYRYFNFHSLLNDIVDEFANYAALNSTNTFRSTQYFRGSNSNDEGYVYITSASNIGGVVDVRSQNGVGAAQVVAADNASYVALLSSNGQRKMVVLNGNTSGSYLSLRNASGTEKTVLSDAGFILNGSTEMTGITHNTAVAANASSTVAKLVSESTLNNYYRKEDLGSRQVIDFTRYFKTGKFGKNAQFLGVANDNFATNLPSNLTSKIGGFATNHPPRLGAFVKCEKACSRLSERFIQAMRENRAFEDIASADAGTFLRVQETNKNVLDNFSQTVANINVVNDNFTVVTNTVAA